MFAAAENLQFETAARLRDELKKLQGLNGTDSGGSPSPRARSERPPARRSDRPPTRASNRPPAKNGVDQPARRSDRPAARGKMGAKRR
jgi:hypothetical protein